MPDEEAPVLVANWSVPIYPNLLDAISIFANFSDINFVESSQIRYIYKIVKGNDAGEDVDFGTFNMRLLQEEGDLSTLVHNIPLTPLAPNDGFFRIKFDATDNAGNEREFPSSTNWDFFVTVDGTAPLTTVNVVNNQFITSDTGIILTFNDVEFTGFPDYEPSGVNFTKFSIDGGALQDYVGVFNIDGDDGIHTIEFYSVDNAGNQEITKTLNVILDNTFPLTTDDYTKNDVWVNADQTITLTPNDDGSGLDWTRYCLTSGCDPFSGTDYTTSVLISTEGITHFRYASADNVGNVESTHEKIVKIDKTNPTTTESGATSDWTNQSVTVTLTCNDGTLSGCKETFFSTNGSIPTLSYSSPFTLSLTGQYQLKYFSTDIAGNLEPTVTGTLVKIDKEVPTITDDYTNDNVWVNSTQIVTLTPEDIGGSGISSVFTCEGIGCTPETLLGAPHELPFLTSQDTIVRYRAFDVAGNPSTVGEFNVKIDLENPSSTITSQNSTDKMDFFIVKADVSDTGGSELENVTLTLKNATHTFIDEVPMTSVVLNEDYEFLMRMWDLEDGVYTLEVTAIDNAGNSFTDAQEFTILSNVAPSKITSTNNQVNATTGGTVSFDFDVVVRNDGRIIFGIDDVIRIGDITGFTPSSLNARVYNGTTNVSVGSGIDFSGAGILALEDSDTETPNVQGTFTLYLDFPQNVALGKYPINYFIDVA